jgi:hypothetical protein
LPYRFFFAHFFSAIEPKCLAKPPLLQHPEPSTYLSASTRYFYAKYRLLLQNFTESNEVWADAVDRKLVEIERCCELREAQLLKKI